MGDGVRGAGDEARVGVWEGASSESPRVAGAAPTPPAGLQLRVETGTFIACKIVTNRNIEVWSVWNQGEICEDIRGAANEGI